MPIANVSWSLTIIVGCIAPVLHCCTVFHCGTMPDEGAFEGPAGGAVEIVYFIDHELEIIDIIG